MNVLWRAEEPLSPGEVQSLLDEELAYTTVMTILTRLWKKGQVNRHRRSRAYAYVAAVTEAELLAQKMSAELRRTKDSQAVLSRFVDTLSSSDAAALRQVLNEMDKP